MRKITLTLLTASALVAFSAGDSNADWRCWFNTKARGCDHHDRGPSIGKAIIDAIKDNEHGDKHHTKGGHHKGKGRGKAVHSGRHHPDGKRHGDKGHGKSIGHRDSHRDRSEKGQKDKDRRDKAVGHEGDHQHVKDRGR